MRAWVFDRFGPPGEVLVRRDMPVPVPGPGQLLVRIGAASINFADDVLIRGQYQLRPDLPAVAGSEYMGRVVGGPNAGLRVAGMVAGLCGSYAQFAVVDKADALVVPEFLNDMEAAAFTVAYQTAWFALHRRGGLASADTVMVHAAAGGVGSAAVQLAVAAGATVIGIVGSREKAKLALELGCKHVFLRGDSGTVEAIKQLTGPRGVQVVIDPVGGDAHELSERVVGFEGRIVIVGFASGAFPVVRAERALVKNYAVIGLHWGLYRRLDPELVAREYETLCEALERACIRPIIDRVLDFDKAPRALADVAAGSSVGRIVVRVP